MKKTIKIIGKVIKYYLYFCILAHAACGVTTALERLANNGGDIFDAIDYETELAIRNARYFWCKL